MIKRLLTYISPSLFKKISLLKFNWKYHSWRNTKNKKQVIICFDAYGLHGGLVDRLKGIISVYYLSKIYGYDFKINFTHPYHLQDYLIPAAYDWYTDIKDLSWNVFNTKFIDARNTDTELALIQKTFKKGKRKIFIYTNIDFLPQIIKKAAESNVIWSNLFSELFSFSPNLIERVDSYSTEYHISSSAVGIHTRFTTLLGDFEDVTERWLSSSEQVILMQKVWCQIKELYIKENWNQLILFSDSIRFLEFAKFKNAENNAIDLIILPGNPSHSDRSSVITDGYFKSFLDFMMMSRLSAMYSLVTDKMYPSAFPAYAAKLADSPFRLIQF